MTRAHEGRRGRRLSATETDLEVLEQRALLVGTDADELDELARLVSTAGARPVERTVQRRERPDPATYIGKGKVAEVEELCTALDIDVVVFDDELSPAQQRNLESRFQRDVVDRVALILDIFAQHATSQEGMVQVELAQLRYLAPRLRGQGMALSRQEGGTGIAALRGPGETKLEVDRRRIGRRVAKLERDLDRLAATRATQRKSRRRGNLAGVALVGYTNAGKSTLLNRLTAADVLVEDLLFSTLDPTTRRLDLPGGETVLLSDTVGFVKKLPHQLVEAFRSTLDEVLDARLLLHVVDCASEVAEDQILAVREVLREIAADDVPELLVLNQADVATVEQIAELERAHPEAVTVSAVTGTGIDTLLARLVEHLRVGTRTLELSIPIARSEVLAALHRDGEILAQVHDATATHVTVRLSDAGRGRYREFIAR